MNISFPVQKPAQPAEHQFLSPEDRVNMPTIRGGLNGSIADILEASGYGTETDFRTDVCYERREQKVS